MASEAARLDARRRAENDLWFLATEILEWGDKGFLEPDFHVPLCRWIEKSDVGPGQKVNRTRMLLWPRYHGKTTLFTVADNIRLQLRHPGMCVAIGHDGKDDAEKIMGQIRAEFEDKKLLKWIAPDICFQNPKRESPLWNIDAFMLRRRAFYRVPSFMAVSPDAMPTGFHFDVWNWDDLVTWENSRTQIQRQRCKNAYSLVQPFLPAVRMGYHKIAGTRWHLDDAYGHLISLGEKIRLDSMVSGMLAPDGEPWMRRHYCHERTGPDDNRKTLDELREGMGGEIFAACMMQDPKPVGTAAFHTDDVQRYKLIGAGRKEWLPPIDGRAWEFFTAVDLNTQAHTAGDFAVVLTAARSDANHLVVVDVSRGRPTRHQLVDWVARHNTTWRPRRVFVETVGYQKTFVADLAEERAKTLEWMPVEQVTRGGHKTGLGKNDRIMGLQGLVEARKLWVPEGERFDFLLDEIKEFAPESDSAHDDGLDCLADVFRIGSRPEPQTSPTQPLSINHVNAQMLTDWFMANVPSDCRSEDGQEVVSW